MDWAAASRSPVRGVTKAGAGIEDSDGDAVAGFELGESELSGVGDFFHVREHAAADVEQEHDVQGSFVAGEMDDGLGLIVVEDAEVGGGEAVEDAGAVDDLGIDADKRDVGAERRRVAGKGG